jgi:hypothetical protein
MVQLNRSVKKKISDKGWIEIADGELSFFE